MWDAHTRELVPKASVSRSSEPPREPNFSNTVVRRVLHDKQALICGNVQGNPAFDAMSSVFRLGIQSFACVPILRDGEPQGVIYLDCRLPDMSFSEADLRVLSVIANEAGLALENAVLCERLKLESDILRHKNVDLQAEIARMTAVGGSCIRTEAACAGLPISSPYCHEQYQVA